MIVASIMVLIGIMTISFTNLAPMTATNPFPYNMDNQILLSRIPQTIVYTIWLIRMREMPGVCL
jgi:hypothetical protein